MSFYETMMRKASTILFLMAVGIFAFSFLSIFIRDQAGMGELPPGGLGWKFAISLLVQGLSGATLPFFGAAFLWAYERQAAEKRA